MKAGLGHSPTEEDFARDSTEVSARATELLIVERRGPDASNAGVAPLEASDTELLAAARTGDGDAFHKLVDRYANDLFRVALSLTRNRDDAEDVLQETFLGAYRGLTSFAGRSSVKTWLIQILTRQAAKSWNRNKNGRNTLSLDQAQLSPDAGGRTLQSDASTRSAEQRIDLMHVLQCMSPAHREVLVLREMRGLSYDEMARVLDVPRGTIESRLSRARAEFRQRIDPGGSGVAG